MKSIVVFNNKGGVGKTTLLCNIASFLKIRKNKRILVIDTDPQCNTTTYVFPYSDIERIYSSQEKEKTISKIVDTIKKGKGYEENINLLIKTSPHFKFDIIPGDSKLSLSEDFLSKDWFDAKSGEYRGLQTTLLFRDLLSRINDRYDFVFFDVGPSLGALNRSVLAACDYFIVPMSSDIFSIQALENISTQLKQWSSDIIKGLCEYQEKEQESFQINNENVLWHLKFGGYITQQYTAKTVGGQKQPVNAYEKIIKRIPNAIERYLLTLNTIQIPHSKIGEITNLSSLVPLSQSSNAPIFDLKAKDGVVGAHFNKVKEYETTLSDMVDKLIINISKTYDNLAK